MYFGVELLGSALKRRVRNKELLGSGISMLAYSLEPKKEMFFYNSLKTQGLNIFHFSFVSRFLQVFAILLCNPNPWPLLAVSTFFKILFYDNASTHTHTQMLYIIAQRRKKRNWVYALRGFNVLSQGTLPQ